MTKKPTAKSIRQQMKLIDLSDKFITADEWDTLLPEHVKNVAYAQGHQFQTSIGIAHDSVLGWCVIGVSEAYTLLYCQNMKEWNKI